MVQNKQQSAEAPILVSLQITHPAQKRLAAPYWSTSPILYVPQEPDKFNCCETGPTVFHFHPRRLEIHMFAYK